MTKKVSLRSIEEEDIAKKIRKEKKDLYFFRRKGNNNRTGNLEEGSIYTQNYCV